MPRIRTVKPDFWDDEKLALISREARLTYIGLWTYSDDHGVVKGHPKWLKEKIYPYDELDIKTFESWLAELENLKRILPFDANGERYYFIPKFLKHQKIDRPSKTTPNPSPPQGLAEDSLNIRRALPVVREGKVVVIKERKKHNKSIKKERKGIF